MGGGQLRVIFPEVAGEPEDFDQIRKIILDILPCHLEVEFYFRYLTWAECEAAGYTWGQVEAANTPGRVSSWRYRRSDSATKKAAAAYGRRPFSAPEETGRAAV